MISKWIAKIFGLHTNEEYNTLADKYQALQKENINLFTELKEQKALYDMLQKEIEKLKQKIAEFEKDKISVTLISDNEIDSIIK